MQWSDRAGEVFVGIRLPVASASGDSVGGRSCRVVRVWCLPENITHNKEASSMGNRMESKGCHMLTAAATRRCENREAKAGKKRGTRMQYDDFMYDRPFDYMHTGT